jgi:PAS domain-containing protein
LPSPEATLDAVAGAMPIAYLLLDWDRRVLRCGGRSAAQLGLSPSLSVGKSIDVVLGAHDCIGEGVSAALSGVTHVAALSVNGHYFTFQFMPAIHNASFITVVATEISANVFWNQFKTTYRMAFLR